MNDELVIPTDVLEKWETSVTSGMKFLDNYYGSPNWVKMLDLEELDLNDSTTCVCGQLFDEDGQKLAIDGYNYALKFVIEHEPQYEHAESEDAASLGFYLPGLEYEDEDYDLRIEERIAEANGIGPFEMKRSAWELFTDYWQERLEKRLADLGAL